MHTHWAEHWEQQSGLSLVQQLLGLQILQSKNSKKVGKKQWGTASLLYGMPSGLTFLVCARNHTLAASAAHAHESDLLFSTGNNATSCCGRGLWPILM